jgi:hypothetical protein
MKFVITESKFKNAVYKYLDNQDFIIKDNNKQFNNYIYFLNSENDDHSVISVYKKNAFGEERDWVFVHHNLIDEISGFFSMSYDNSVELITSWVGHKLGFDLVLKGTNWTNGHRFIIPKNEFN